MGRTLAGSLDPDQVLAVGTDAACRLLATDRAFVVLRDPVHGGLRVAAATGPLAKELLTRFHPTLERSGIYRKVLQERRVVAIEDMDACPDADPIAKELASRSLLAAPLLSRGEVSGVLYIDDCRHKRRFTEAEQERLMAVAGRLALAIENARLYAEARGRLSELSTVIDVARVISSSLDLEKVLTAGAEHLKETLRAEACTILLEEPEGGVLRRAAHRGPPVGSGDCTQGPAHPGLGRPRSPGSPVTGSLGEEQASPSWRSRCTCGISRWAWPWLLRQARAGRARTSCPWSRPSPASWRWRWITPGSTRKPAGAPRSCRSSTRWADFWWRASTSRRRWKPA